MKAGKKRDRQGEDDGYFRGLGMEENVLPGDENYGIFPRKSFSG